MEVSVTTQGMVLSWTWLAAWCALVILATIVPGVIVAFYIAAIPGLVYIVGAVVARLADDREEQEAWRRHAFLGQLAVATLVVEQMLANGMAVQALILLRATGRQGRVEANALADLVLDAEVAKTGEKSSLGDTSLGRSFLGLEPPSIDELKEWLLPTDEVT